MFGSIALFLFASFCVWGWILIWPIRKAKTKGLKGWCSFALTAMLVISLCFSLGTFTSNQPVTGDLIRSDFGQMFSSIDLVFLWITFLAGLIFSFFYVHNGNSNKNDAGEYFGITFATIFGIMVAGMAVFEFVFRFLLQPFLFPLFQALF